MRSGSVVRVIGQQVVRSGLITVSFCRVWDCMSDLIVNVALEALYIHEGGGSDGVIDS